MIPIVMCFQSTLPITLPHKKTFQFPASNSGSFGFDGFDEASGRLEEGSPSKPGMYESDRAVVDKDQMGIELIIVSKTDVEKTREHISRIN